MKYTLLYNRIIVCIGILLAIIIWSLYQCKNPNIVMDHVKEYFKLDEDILSSDIPITLTYNNNNYISVTFNYKNHPIVKTVTEKDNATKFYIEYMGKHENSINIYCIYFIKQDQQNSTRKYITYNSNNERELINNKIYFDDIGGGDNQKFFFKDNKKIYFNSELEKILDYNSNTNTLELKDSSNLTVDFEPPSVTSTEYTQKAIVYRDDFPNTVHNNTSTNTHYIRGSGYGDITDNNELIPYFKNVWETQSDTQGDTKWYLNLYTQYISFTEFDNNDKTCKVEFSDTLKNKLNSEPINELYNYGSTKIGCKIISSNLIIADNSISRYKIYFQIVPTPISSINDNRSSDDQILYPLYYLKVWAIKKDDPLTIINLSSIGNKESYFIKVHEKYKEKVERVL